MIRSALTPEQREANRQTALAMKAWGGSFVSRLGELYPYGDEDNQRRIREAWPEIWKKYTRLAKKAGGLDE